MKTIIAGTRTFRDYTLLEEVLLNLSWEVSEVVCGCSRGADQLGERWARVHKVPCVRFPAEWNRRGSEYDPLAGLRRNVQMGKYADALVLFWDGRSKGSKHMMKVAEVLELKTKIIRYEELDL